MAIVEVKTFKDIQDAIIRRAKLEDTAAVRLDLKEKINTAYQSVSFEEAYRWSGQTLPIKLLGRYTTGTITATKDSNQITGASTVWTEFDHRYAKMKISGSNTPYRILNVFSNTTLALDAPWLDTTGSAKTYEIYQDEYGMFPNFQDIRKLRISGISLRQQPQPTSPEDIDILRDRSPFNSGAPRFYTIYGQSHYVAKTWADFNWNTDFWEPDLDAPPTNSNLIIWPGNCTTARVAQIRYTKRMIPMGVDADEPLIPYENRSVLVWGPLQEYFLQKRDLTTHREWKSEYKEQKKKMAGDIENTDDELILILDRSEFSRKSKFVVYEDYENS